MRRPISGLHAALTVALALGLAACRSATGPRDELATARLRWAQRGPAAYAMTVSIGCECVAAVSQPAEVAVRDRVVESRRYVASGEPVPDQYAGAFPTVEELFDRIEQGLRTGTHPLVARYDPALGYPTHVELGDPAADAPMYVVTNFRRR